MSNLNNSQGGWATLFSGSNISIIFGDEYIGECMSFTLGTNREVAPVNVLGKTEPIGMAKGKRGIGGSFVLAQLGYNALLEYIGSIQKDDSKRKVFVRNEEIVPQMNAKSTIAPGANATNVTGAINAVSTDLWTQTDPFYVDQIPPFNITVVGFNETGDKMGFRVYGVTILNNGFGVSVDELNMEEKYTFIAFRHSKMVKLQ